MEEYREFSIQDTGTPAPEPGRDARRAGFLHDLGSLVRFPRENFSAAVLLETAFLVIGFLGIAYSLAFRTFFIASGVLTASVVGPAFAMVVASRGLRMRGVGFERVFVGLACSVSGIWLFETLYHYGWNGTFTALSTNLLTFNIDTGMGNYFPLPWAIIMIVLPAVAYKRMNVNVIFVLLLLGTLAGFWAWTNAGYPQFTYSGPDSLQGAIYNTVTKLLVCLLPASLFLPFGRIGVLPSPRPTPASEADDPSRFMETRPSPGANRSVHR